MVLNSHWYIWQQSFGKSMYWVYHWKSSKWSKIVQNKMYNVIHYFNVPKVITSNVPIYFPIGCFLIFHVSLFCNRCAYRLQAVGDIKYIVSSLLYQFLGNAGEQEWLSVWLLKEQSWGPCRSWQHPTPSSACLFTARDWMAHAEVSQLLLFAIFCPALFYRYLFFSI